DRNLEKLRRLTEHFPYPGESHSNPQLAFWKVLLRAYNISADTYLPCVRGALVNTEVREMVRNLGLCLIGSQPRLRRIRRLAHACLSDAFVWRNHGTSYHRDCNSSSSERWHKNRITYIQGTNVLAASIPYTVSSELKLFFCGLGSIIFSVCPAYVRRYSLRSQSKIFPISVCLFTVLRNIHSFPGTNVLCATAPS
ncbi:hypothetical protein F5880DRAFT_1482566, partial [Lentinula raphanica]